MDYKREDRDPPTSKGHGGGYIWKCTCVLWYELPYSANVSKVKSKSLVMSRLDYSNGLWTP